MKNRIPLYMVIAVVVGFAVIIGLNLLAKFNLSPSASYIAPNEVRGMAVEHNQLLYTLNFEQQNAFVDVFNRLTPISNATVEAKKQNPFKPPAASKIIIYRFNKSDVEITPVANVKNDKAVSKEHVSLVFSIPEWNAKELLQEAPEDQIQQLLLNTYDH